MKYKLRYKLNYLIFYGFILLITQTSCKKLVEINPPTSSITTSQVFADSADANSALLGIYSKMINDGNMACGFPTVYNGMSADELLPFLSEGDQFSTNVLNQGNDQILGSWSNAYKYIYQANASIEGLNASKGITSTAKTSFIAEAKFLRALIYFYLVNLFGDVPYVAGSDYKVNALASRMPKDQVYDSIINDLKFAQMALPGDYSYYGGERVRATRPAAGALLSRVYLYTKNWSEAEKTATSVIDNGNYSIDIGLDQVFSVNNSEAILQWRLNTNVSPFNANKEGITFIPYRSNSQPFYYLTEELLNSFESNDQRKLEWVGSTNYLGTIYYYPYKYKIGYFQRVPGSTPTEYYNVLRLAEQFLIRAEARAENNTDLTGAIDDLNRIRGRAGLDALSQSLDQEQILAAVAQERRIEFFAEWGHRWLDLKRTGQADAVLKPIKSLWQSYQQLYPIPMSEMRLDPNLVQNPGYH